MDRDRRHRFIRISMDIPHMRKISVIQGKISFSDNVVGFIEKKVTPFGNSAKVDCPKEFIGKRVYLIICKE